jgi:hypothetical protein
MSELWAAAARLELYASKDLRDLARLVAGDYQATVHSENYPDKGERAAEFCAQFQGHAAEVQQMIRKELGVK